MDFRHLQQFIVLAETLNFRRAAEKLHMSQPPLSVSIRKLETELGVTLFTRGKDGVRLTKSGEAALSDARRALFHANEFAQAARSAMTGDGGILRIGFVGSTTHSILPNLLMPFRSTYPGVQLELREATSIQIMDLLESGALDVGLVRVPVSSSTKCRLQPLQTEHFMLAMSRQHPLAGKTRIRLQSLSQEPFILYTAAHAAGLRMAAIHACQLTGFTPHIAQEAIQVQTVLSLVEAGLGIALVPSMIRTSVNDRILCKPLVDFPSGASIGISLAWRPEAETGTVRNIRRIAQDLYPRQQTVA